MNVIDINPNTIENLIIQKFQELFLTQNSTMQLIQAFNEEIISKLQNNLKFKTRSENFETTENSAAISEMHEYINLISEKNSQNYMIIKQNLYEIKKVFQKILNYTKSSLKTIQEDLPSEILHEYINLRISIETEHSNILSFLDKFLSTLEDFTNTHVSLNSFVDFTTEKSYSFDEENESVVAVKTENKVLKEQIEINEKKLMKMNQHCQEMIKEIERHNITANHLREIIERLRHNQSISHYSDLEQENLITEKNENFYSVSQIFETHLETLKYHIHSRDLKIKDIEHKYKKFEELDSVNESLREEIEKFQRELGQVRKFEQECNERQADLEREIMDFRQVVEEKNEEIENLKENLEFTKFEIIENQKIISKNIDFEEKLKFSPSKNKFFEDFENNKIAEEILVLNEKIKQKDSQIHDLQIENYSNYQKDSLKPNNFSLNSFKLSEILKTLSLYKLDIHDFSLLARQELNILFKSFENFKFAIAEVLSTKKNNEKRQKEKIVELEDLNETLLASLEALKESFRVEVKMMNLEIQDLKNENKVQSNSLESFKNSIENNEKYMKSLLQVLPSFVEKTPTSLKKYFSLLQTVIGELSAELEETNPENFFEKIGDIKADRDASYLQAQRLTDILNELEEFTQVPSSQLLKFIQNNALLGKNYCIQINEFFMQKIDATLVKINAAFVKLATKTEKIAKTLKKNQD